MNTINDRIDFLRTELNMTKTAFADRLKVTQSYISKLINVGGMPSDRLIDDICEKYNVNEEWLRNGTGEMFRIIPAEDENAVYVSELLEDEDNPLYFIIKSIMKTYLNLDPASKRTLELASEELLHALLQDYNYKIEKED